MKKQSVIKSVESKMDIPEPVLLTAISRWKKDDHGFAKKENSFIPEGFHPLNWSSAISKISGMVEITFTSEKDEKINHLGSPFNSWFLFSCINEHDEGYKIGWAVSLS